MTCHQIGEKGYESSVCRDCDVASRLLIFARHSPGENRLPYPRHSTHARSASETVQGTTSVVKCCFYLFLRVIHLRPTQHIRDLGLLYAVRAVSGETLLAWRREDELDATRDVLSSRMHCGETFSYGSYNVRTPFCSNTFLSAHGGANKTEHCQRH